MDKEAIKKALKAFHLYGWDRAPKTLDMDKWIRELLEENERLEAERKKWTERAGKHLAERVQVEQERDAYREALGWIAGVKFTGEYFESICDAALNIRERARQALGEEQMP